MSTVTAIKDASRAVPRAPQSTPTSGAGRASHTTGLCMTTAAIVMGVAIPALIYALTRIGAALYIDGSK